MAENTTPVAEATAAQTPEKAEKKKKSPATHEQKQRRRRIIRRVITLLVVVAVIAVAAYLLKKYVFTDDENGLGEPMVMPVTRGSIQSMVQGMGNARAKNAAVVTPEAGYTMLELFVSEGDTVEEGQLLYNLDDTVAQNAVRDAQAAVLDAQEGVRKAQEAITDYDRELEKAQENLANLTITAPHAGKLTKVQTIKVGDDLVVNTSVATVINDTKLRLSLYYSWAYEGQITPGMSARINLPASMADYPGTVEKVNYVKRVVPEGSVTFEVVFVMDNPGTLTEGMTASAALVGAGGETLPILPYESGKLEYYETSEILVKVAGPVEYVSLMNYADVTEGQVLVRLGSKDALADISAKQNSRREALKVVENAQKTVENAQKAVEEAQEKLEGYHAVAPISGKVLSLGGLMTGDVVPAGAQIQIADTATMLVDINIDERNIGYVTPGMFVDLQDQMGNYYMGVVETVALTAKAENGVASFPATVAVDNPDGMLMTNSYVNYSFIASQSNDCLIVPIQAVINVTLPDGAGDMSGGMDMMGIPDGMGMLPMEEDFIDDVDDAEVDDLPADDTLDDGEVADDDVADDTDTDDAAVDGAVVDIPASGSISTGDIAISRVPVVRISDAMVPRAGGVVVSVAGMGFSSSQGASAFSTPGTATVCFVKGEPDERAIEADESWNMPEGFFAVRVTTGLSDEQNVEITSGLNEGDEVFYGYMTNNAYTGW